jgi:hypothetical protein
MANKIQISAAFNFIPGAAKDENFIYTHLATIGNLLGNLSVGEGMVYQ